MNELKDSLANTTTLAGTGSAMMGLNEILTLGLIVTGIILNVVRILAIRRDKKKDQPS